MEKYALTRSLCRYLAHTVFGLLHASQSANSLSICRACVCVASHSPKTVYEKRRNTVKTWRMRTQQLTQFQCPLQRTPHDQRTKQRIIVKMSQAPMFMSHFKGKIKYGSDSLINLLINKNYLLSNANNTTKYSLNFTEKLVKNSLSHIRARRPHIHATPKIWKFWRYKWNDCTARFKYKLHCLQWSWLRTASAQRWLKMDRVHVCVFDGLPDVDATRTCSNDSNFICFIRFILIWQLFEMFAILSDSIKCKSVQ